MVNWGKNWPWFIKKLTSLRSVNLFKPLGQLFLRIDRKSSLLLSKIQLILYDSRSSMFWSQKWREITFLLKNWAFATVCASEIFQIPIVNVFQPECLKKMQKIIQSEPTRNVYHWAQWRYTNRREHIRISKDLLIRCYSQVNYQNYVIVISEHLFQHRC